MVIVMPVREAIHPTALTQIIKQVELISFNRRGKDCLTSLNVD
jgi:hypothetical protein